MKAQQVLTVLTLGMAFIVPGLALAAPPTVVTVPWRGALNLPHETYNGKAIHLKGIAKNVSAGATATWDPGDGSGVVPVAVAAGSDFGLQKIHTYPNSSAGTPYTATLTVCNNPGNECASAQYTVVVKNRTLNTEINVAIDEALWYAHRTQNKTTGDWAHSGNYGGYGDVSFAAASVQAFQINNHFETGNPLVDPYAETVQKGLQHLFTRMATYALPNPPTVGRDPELGQATPNRLAVNIPYSPRPIYELGSVMDAIVSSKTPNAVASTGPAGIVGRTYKDLVQDMVDMYAYGQYNNVTPYGGGWRYNWFDFPDNSACQWAAIGILAARDLWGCTVPQWVIDRNLNWLNYSRVGTPAYGYGYTGPGEGDALSPSGLVQLIMDGIPKTDTARWVGVENRLASLWNSWYRDSGNYYALFALAKAMRLALPEPIVQMAQGTANQIDWFGADCANPAACSSAEKWGVARTLLRDQNADGAFAGENWLFGGAHSLPHAWATIILTGTLEVPPVAIAKAHPNPAANGQTIYFDALDSYHPDPSKGIVSYEWDFDGNGTPDASGTTASFIFPVCNTLPTPCNYPVTLKVKDNSTPTPLVGIDTITVRTTIPPHPPTANAGGPYWVCTNEALQLDGSKSYDIDVTSGDSITAWNWELNMVAPYDFLEAAGVTPAVTWTFGVGVKNIGLRVTDNTSSFPNLGPNLTDDNFTTVNAWDCSCFGNLMARAKPGKIDLVWPPVVGAASYDIYRSTVGPNAGFSLLKANHVTTYATYADFGLTNGTTYWYRVVPKPVVGAQVCGGSKAASARPMAR